MRQDFGRYAKQERQTQQWGAAIKSVRVRRLVARFDQRRRSGHAAHQRHERRRAFEGTGAAARRHSWQEAQVLDDVAKALFPVHQQAFSRRAVPARQGQPVRIKRGGIGQGKARFIFAPRLFHAAQREQRLGAIVAGNE